jgi:hypothetical protein
MLNISRATLTGRELGVAALTAEFDGVSIYASPYCNNANCKETTQKYAEGIAAIVRAVKAATTSSVHPNGIVVSWYQNEWDNPQIVARAGGSPLFSYQTVFYLDSLGDCLKDCGAACGAGESYDNVLKHGRNFTDLVLELRDKVQWLGMNHGNEDIESVPASYWSALAAFQHH